MGVGGKGQTMGSDSEDIHKQYNRFKAEGWGMGYPKQKIQDE